MGVELAERNIFITGGTGFVGRTLLDYFLGLYDETGQRFQVTLLSRDPESFLRRYPAYGARPWLRFVCGSLENLPSPDVRYTDVIHAAADTHLQGQGVQWIQQIVNGTHAVLQFALESGAKRFLLTSSGAVYGPQPTDIEKLDENYVGAPATTLITSTYGQAKRVAEQLCTIYYREHGLQTVMARCFAFAGKHLPLDGPYAFGNFIRDALYHDAIRVRGDGTAVRSYLDGEDLADWLVSLLCRGHAGEAYNVGAEHGITMRQLADTISHVLAPHKPVLIESCSQQDSNRSIYIPSTQKAQALGLHSRFSLEEIIHRTVSSFTDESCSQKHLLKV